MVVSKCQIGVGVIGKLFFIRLINVIYLILRRWVYRFWRLKKKIKIRGVNIQEKCWYQICEFIFVFLVSLVRWKDNYKMLEWEF